MSDTNSQLTTEYDAGATPPAQEGPAVTASKNSLKLIDELQERLKDPAAKFTATDARMVVDSFYNAAAAYRETHNAPMPKSLAIYGEFTALWTVLEYVAAGRADDPQAVVNEALALPGLQTVRITAVIGLAFEKALS